MRKKKYDISILMPVFNAAEFLTECLDSIFAQSIASFELICVDDYSEDKSWEILEGYKENHENLFIYKNRDEKGIIPALRIAFSKSSGAFITRMDADDIMPKNKLQLMHEKISIGEPKSVVTGLVSYFSKDKLQAGFIKYAEWLNQLTLAHKNFDSIYKECVIASPCWMIRRLDLESVNAFNLNTYPEDYDLVFRFYKAGFKVSPIDKVLHYWRDHPSRASRNDAHYKDQSFLNLKLNYFLELDYNKNKTLVLWGAGKKGKNLSTFLLKKGIPFRWISANEKKIGKEIYGVNIESEVILMENFPRQIIQIIASKDFAQQKLTLYKKYQISKEELFEFV